MAVGKSTVGKLGAELRGGSFADLDDVIVADAGASVPEIFEEGGEAGFRARELASLEGLLDTVTRGVVALGGGTLHQPQALALLQDRGVEVVVLTLSDEARRARVAQVRASGDAERPLLHAAEALYRNRAEGYETAGIQVDVSGLSPTQAAAAVLSALERS